MGINLNLLNRVSERGFAPLQKNTSPSPLKERGIKGVRLIGKNIEQITEEDLQALIDNSVLDGKRKYTFNTVSRSIIDE